MTKVNKPKEEELQEQVLIEDGMPSEFGFKPKPIVKK